MASRYKTIKRWGVMADDMLLMSMCDTRASARDVAKLVRRVNNLHGKHPLVRVVRLEVNIHD